MVGILQTRQVGDAGERGLEWCLNRLVASGPEALHVADVWQIDATFVQRGS
jgi:hypothetical protein